MSVGLLSLKYLVCDSLLKFPSLDTGAQPLVNDDESLALAVNGEIYNHRILRKNLKTKYNFKTHSDCEVIIPLVRLVNAKWWRWRCLHASVYGARP